MSFCIFHTEVAFQVVKWTPRKSPTTIWISTVSMRGEGRILGMILQYPKSCFAIFIHQIQNSPGREIKNSTHICPVVCTRQKVNSPSWKISHTLQATILHPSPSFVASPSSFDGVLIKLRCRYSQIFSLTREIKTAKKHTSLLRKVHQELDHQIYFVHVDGSRNCYIYSIVHEMCMGKSV